jgi:hypothetical protein
MQFMSSWFEMKMGEILTPFGRSTLASAPFRHLPLSTYRHDLEDSQRRYRPE